jgi:diguanylate cyclase (GGDEF)-like protein
MSAARLEGTLGDVGAVTAVYLLVTLGTLAAHRLPRGTAVALYGLSLMLDGIFLAWASYVTGGAGSPARYLILLHLMTVVLLASYRTGMKLALWHSLLLVVVFYAQDGGLLRPLDADPVPLGIGTPTQQLVAFSAAFWFVALAAASFAAINERELRRRRYDLEALAAMATRMEEVTDPASVAGALVDGVVETLGFERVVLVGQSDGRTLEVLAARGRADESQTCTSLRPKSVLREVLAGRQTRLIKKLDPHTDTWLDQTVPGARNLIIVPLSTEAHAIGALIVEHDERRGSRVERRVVATVERFASYGAVALRNAWLLDEVQRVAATDGLTGLANRLRFQETLNQEIERAARADEPLALAMIDLDNFKTLNDTRGHQAGDDALRLAAAAISEGCRSFDTAGRYGGEEFAVILPRTDGDDALAVAERLRALVAGRAAVTASIGVAVFPQDGGSPDALIGAADVAMYESKRAGRNRVTLALTR